MNTAAKHLESIGHLCASLQAPYVRIRKAVEALGIEPAITINGIAHFDDAQCEQIAGHIAKPKIKKEA